MDSLAPQYGRYQLRGQLGSGGMGQVFRAFDPRLRREVALKAIRHEALRQDSARQRFVSEARALAAIADPHVVRIYDFDPGPESPWLVMELVEGHSLRHIIREGRPASAQELQRCALEVCAGLAAIHHAGLVHRDIKPDNIMRRSSTGGHVLLDLGLVNDGQGDNNLTVPGSIMGTVRYLSPERTNGAAATPASDCYALGVSLYELAQAAPLYEKAEALVILQRIANDPPLDLGPRRPDLSPAWLAWWRRLCHRDPQQRFHHAGEALLALRQLNEAVDSVPLAADHSSASAVTLPISIPLHGATAASGSPSPSQPTVSKTLRPKVETISSTMAIAPAKARPRRRLRFVYKMVITLWLTSTAAAVVTGVALSHTAIGDQLQRLRELVSSAAASAVLSIDGEQHQRLVALGPQAVDDPYFATLKEELTAFRRAWPRVRFIYTMRQLNDDNGAGAGAGAEGIVAFVVDASDEIDVNGNGVIDPEEMVATPGTRYNASSMPRLHEGFQRASADDGPITDQWGTWLSGYAPIRLANGELSGSLLGMDVPVEQLNAMRRDFMMQALVLVGSSLLAFVAAGWLLAQRLRKPVEELHRGMLAVANGDLDAEVHIRSGDEFEDLAEAFTSMRQRLRAGQAMREGFERFVLHTLAAQRGMGLNPQEQQTTVTMRLDFGPESAESGEGRGEQNQASDLPSMGFEQLLACIHDHGGILQALSADHLILNFNAAHPQDLPEERALLCALQLLAEGRPWQSPTAIALVGCDGSESPTRLARLAQMVHVGADLLIGEECFAHLASRVVADRLADQQGRALYAVKALL